MITATHKETTFGVGDRIKVTQRIKEGEKSRSYAFEGIVLGIRGRDVNRSFTVRRIGEAKIGIERIFPLASPTLEKVEVLRHGKEGIRHAKLYYTRSKSKREIEKIFSRALNKNQINKPRKTAKAKKSKKAS